MVVKTEGMHPCEYLVSEASGHRSRDTIVVGAEQDFEPGAVLGKTTVTPGTDVTVAADGGNTGNGTLTEANPAYADGAAEGEYVIECTEAAANGGTFSVTAPDGTVLDPATVGVAYDGQIKFTIADGATDFVLGDKFTFTVDYSHNDAVWKQVDPGASDGTEVAAAIAMYGAKTLPGETTEIAAHVRECEVRESDLAWPDGMTFEQKQAAIAQLRDNASIVAR